MKTPTGYSHIPFSRFCAVALIGAAAGILAGMFGVGGGMVIVPALTAVMGMTQRRAAATSLAAIIVTSAAGALSYGLAGEVCLPAMLCVSCGAICGTQIGTWLLRILPERILPWIFCAFACCIIVAEQFHVSVRESRIEISFVSVLLMIGIGIVSGTFAGLVGVGGGGIIVPGLELLAGAGDLLARGTSLLVMIPTSLSGTAANIRHRVADLRTGLVIGVTATLTTPCGVKTAQWITPRTGSYLFSLFLIAMIVSTLLKGKRKAGKNSRH